MADDAPRHARRFLSARAIDVPETRYKADFELLDRYVGSSSELLRMALAGMAALGAVVALLTHDGAITDPLRSTSFAARASVALAMLSLAAGFALMHRYLASDGMSHDLRATRLLVVRGDPDIRGDETALAELDGEVRAEQAGRTRQFKRAAAALFASVGLLIAGVLCLALSIAALLAVLLRP